MTSGCTWLLYGVVAAGVVGALWLRSIRSRRGPTLGPSEARLASEAWEKRQQWERFLRTKLGKATMALGWFALLVGFCYGGLWQYYDATRPTQTLPSLGRTFELDTHGHVVFLTPSEKLRLDVLQYGTIALFFGVAGIWVLWQRRNPRPPLR